MRIASESEAGSDGDPLGITAAERLRVGQTGYESVTFGLARLWQTERRPPDSSDIARAAAKWIGSDGQPGPAISPG